jgi:predicted RNase H-like HicB family nuclease
MQKRLDEYMRLPYAIEIIPISEDEGGGYTASIPQLGKFAFTGDGETIEEAIQNLNEVKKDLFSRYLQKGISIPLPKAEADKDFSGRFVLRIPVELHRYLSAEARKNGSTLNQFCLYLLTRKSTLHTIQEELSLAGKEMRSVFESIIETDYQVEHPPIDNNGFSLKEYKKSA